jgi:hypothetical protein
MITFSEYRRDALRYRALASTDQASPWANVLGGHKKLDGLADALVDIIKKDHAEGRAKDVVFEDAPTMGVSAVAGVAPGDQPPVSKLAQRKWIKRNNIVRRRT